VRLHCDRDGNPDCDEGIPKQGLPARVPLRGRMSPVIANQSEASCRFPFGMNGKGWRRMILAIDRFGKSSIAHRAMHRSDH
jgi:hypothetical protein